jgi:hypothetical protein
MSKQMLIKIGCRVMIKKDEKNRYGGMFGVVTHREHDGLRVFYRVRLDEPPEGSDGGKNILWPATALRPYRTSL